MTRHLIITQAPARMVIKVKGHQYRWFADGYDLEVGHVWKCCHCGYLVDRGFYVHCGKSCHILALDLSKTFGVDMCIYVCSQQNCWSFKLIVVPYMLLCCPVDGFVPTMQHELGGDFGQCSVHARLMFITLYTYTAFPTLWDDKVSVLTHTYPHKPVRKIKWPAAVTRLTPHLLMAWNLIWWFGNSMIIHDTECPCWDQMSLNSTVSKASY